MHEKWKANTALALKLWQERVKPEQVWPELRSWGCGTQACFGGHLVTWPEFQAQGLYALEGAPCMDIDIDAPAIRLPQGVSYELFGSRKLFSVRGLCEGFEDESDHAVVVNRLQRHLEFLNKA